METMTNVGTEAFIGTGSEALTVIEAESAILVTSCTGPQYQLALRLDPGSC
jgi:hypothetical protein